MALAVAEAHRVLRPGGCLLDIHPDSAPMRLEIWDASAVSDHRHSPGASRGLGALAAEAAVSDFTAATASLRAASQVGFARQSERSFDYHYFFDSLDELTDYLEENEELDLAGDELLERAVAALGAATSPARLALAQPTVAVLLRKHGEPRGSAEA